MRFTSAFLIFIVSSIGFAAPSYSGLCMAYFNQSKLTGDQTERVKICKIMNTEFKARCVGYMVLDRANYFLDPRRVAGYSYTHELPHAVIMKCAKIQNQFQFSSVVRLILDYRYYLDTASIDLALQMNTAEKSNCYSLTYQVTVDNEDLKNCLK